MGGLWAGRFPRGVHRSRGGRGQCLGVGACVRRGVAVGVATHACRWWRVGAASRFPCVRPRGLAAEGPWVFAHPCRAGQSLLVPSRISSIPVPRLAHSVLDPSHTHPSPPRTRQQLAQRTSNAVPSGCRLLPEPGPSVLHGVIRWWAGWWRGQRTCVASGLCLRARIRVMWSRWRAACGVGDCLHPVCGRRVSRSSRGRNAVRPSESLGQCWSLQFWYCGFGPVALHPCWCTGVRGMRRPWGRG